MAGVPKGRGRGAGLAGFPWSHSTCGSTEHPRLLSPPGQAQPPLVRSGLHSPRGSSWAPPVGARRALAARRGR